MTDFVRDFVMAAHGDLDALKALYADHPDLLNQAHEWRPGQTETPLQAAAHTGNRAIAEYLLAQGAPMTIVAAAMLGDVDAFDRLLAEDPERIHEQGAHNLSLMFHAAVGGSVAIVERIHTQLGRDALARALVTAVTFDHNDLARWLLATGEVDLSETDFRGRTALQVAVEQDKTVLADLLRDAANPADLLTCPECGAVGYAYLAQIDGSPMGAHTKVFQCKACGAEIERRQVG